jgi:hypothetical protein
MTCVGLQLRRSHIQTAPPSSLLHVLSVHSWRAAFTTGLLLLRLQPRASAQKADRHTPAPHLTITASLEAHLWCLGHKGCFCWPWPHVVMLSRVGQRQLDDACCTAHQCHKALIKRACTLDLMVTCLLSNNLVASADGHDQQACSLYLAPHML